MNFNPVKSRGKPPCRCPRPRHLPRSRGEIRKRYREGQEDQLGALGLVTNDLVLRNTIYMQAALEYLRERGDEILIDDEARLSPLSYKHVNMLGHYSFTLSEQIMK